MEVKHVHSSFIQDIPLQSCPRCQSVFIETDHCEACGLWFPKQGKKSFYDLKDEYVESWSPLEKIFPLLEKKEGRTFQTYLVSLKKRALFLLDHLDIKNLKSKKESCFERQLFIEFYQVLRELADYGVSYSFLIENSDRFDESEVLGFLTPYLETLEIRTVKKVRQRVVESVFENCRWLSVCLKSFLMSSFIIMVGYLFFIWKVKLNS